MVSIFCENLKFVHIWLVWIGNTPNSWSLQYFFIPHWLNSLNARQYPRVSWLGAHGCRHVGWKHMPKLCVPPVLSFVRCIVSMWDQFVGSESAQIHTKTRQYHLKRAHWKETFWLWIYEHWFQYHLPWFQNKMSGKLGQCRVKKLPRFQDVLLHQRIQHIRTVGLTSSSDYLD